MLDSTVIDHEIDINGYDIIREDRNRHGGGVAMYVRSSIDYKLDYDYVPTGPDRTNICSVSLVYRGLDEF